MYKGKMFSADFEENTISIQVEGEFRVVSGDYVVLSATEYEELLGKKVKPKKPRESLSFKKPTVKEVHDYCIERNNGINPYSFINHYESNGWKVGKTPMKNWQAAVRTWERNSNQYGTGANNTIDKQAKHDEFAKSVVFGGNQ